MHTCVVLGMHRSGTSLVSRAVNLLGWSLGDEDELIPPAANNAKGFWESSPIVSFHDTILARLGGSWDAPPELPNGWEQGEELPSPEEAQALLDRVFGGADRRAWKDPRTSLLLPYWGQILTIDHALLVLRHPSAVAASLGARSGMDEDWSHYLWLRYVAAAATNIHATFVAYEDVLSDPADWFEGLGVLLDAPASTEAMAAFLEHTDVSLRHHGDAETTSSPLGMLAADVYSQLREDPSQLPPFLPTIGRGELVAGEHPGLVALAEIHEDLGRARLAVAPLVMTTARARSLSRKNEQLGRSVRRLKADRDKARQDVKRLSREIKEQQQHAEQLRQAKQQARRAEEDKRQIRRQLAAARKKSKRLKRDLERLRGRRSVRLALGLASIARPVFRLRRGQLWRSKQVKASGARPARKATRRQEARWRAPSRSGVFHHHVQRLIDSGTSSAFVDAWLTSEDELEQPQGHEHRDGPLVSIIMPTHNRAAIIADAITSVLEQTYTNWELLVCDDASDDDTAAVVRRLRDKRIAYEHLERGGAAAARNAGLSKARGDLIAYLDSDNIWHPRFLETMVAAMRDNPGRWCAYSRYIDVTVRGDQLELEKFDSLPFDYDRLARRNFIDLNSLVHQRVLYEHLGGFDETLVRQQDRDLVLKYAFLREPLYVDRFLQLYRRNEAWDQITLTQLGETSAPRAIAAKVAAYYRQGLPSRDDEEIPTLAILSWDICRNHFSKAYNLAEAMAERTRVSLVGFRFFDEPIFPPYADAKPGFDTAFLDGGGFPDWSGSFARAVALAAGSDVLYAVKPRLPSLGVALLANHHFGRPIVLESNDLESVVTSPRAGQEIVALQLSDVDPADPELLNPYGDLWTGLMEGLAGRIPMRATHNTVLDQHFGGGAFWIRNPKDERHYDPDLYDRGAERQRLGFTDADRVLLFGGMVRRHKGIFELLEMLNTDPTYRLLVVGSRATPDQARLKKQAGDRVTFVDSVDRNEMAAINLASDAVILWLDPKVPASHYQMPFKLTDALAMRVPVVANEIGNLADLAHAGYLRTAAFGDHDELGRVLQEVFSDDAGTARMTEAGRRLYLREFSYDAVRHNLSMITQLAAASPGPLEVAAEFAEFFASFRNELAAHSSAQVSAS